LTGRFAGFSFDRFKSLTFEPPDFERFPALELGYAAAREGGTWGAALNAANEVAVEAFLAERIAYPEIYENVRRAVEEHAFVANPTLDELMRVDRVVRGRVRDRIHGA
jgi:1-deoxy-D-xylulose-5-phosphate reductoisomerase